MLLFKHLQNGTSSSSSCKTAGDGDKPNGDFVIYIFLKQKPKQLTVGEVLSSVLVTNRAAPQGCMLSFILFTLYMADCQNTEENNILFKFAMTLS